MKLLTRMHLPTVTSSTAILLALLPVCLACANTSAGEEVRVKDVARIAGAESIDLIGYGVVIRLDGTGDTDALAATETIAILQKDFDTTIRPADIKSKVIAEVLVIASAPPFHEPGDRVDVNVFSLLDAKSLENGILVMASLLGPSNKVYALAQGRITGGRPAAGTGGQGGETMTGNGMATGVIADAATLKHGQSASFYQNGVMRFLLRHADMATADRIATAINRKFGDLAVARNAHTVAVRMPKEKLHDIRQAAAFAAELQELSLSPDIQSQAIVNERAPILSGEATAVQHVAYYAP